MADPADPPSPLQELEREFHGSLAAAALGVERRVGPLEGAVLAYRRALETEVAREYASAHSLRLQRIGGPSREAAARTLRDLVLALPELAASPSEPLDARQADAEPKKNLRQEPTSPNAEPPALAAVLPRVVARAHDRSLVILGALGGRKRELPDPLPSSTEWIDTTQGGAHAVGNLPARIRQDRVFGVIICDQAISHKHTEPVLAAARAAGVPVGFAGKGGNAGIARALRAIEEQLAAPSPQGEHSSASGAGPDPDSTKPSRSS